MDARYEDARQRRRQWAFGVTAKGDSLAADLAFWRAASASVKFAAIRAMADESEIRGLIRVVDESGEDYLYPEKFFVVLLGGKVLRSCIAA